MPDVMRRLGATPVALAGSAVTIYQASAGMTTTVTSIHVANESGAIASFTIALGADTAGKRFFYQMPVTPGDAFDWTGQLVIESGTTLLAYASAAASLTLTMCGVETT